jgi:hypothetical protein
MTIHEISEQIEQLRAEVDDLRRQLGNIPVRFGGAGGSGDSLPQGTGKYKVLMLIDDLNPGTPQWDYPRFHEHVDPGADETLEG